MTDISHIDMSSRARNPLAERLPARDFAHELAKGDGGEVATDIRAADSPRQPREQGSPATSVRAADAPRQQGEPGRLAAGVGPSPTEIPRTSLAIPLESTNGGTGVAAHERSMASVHPIGVTEALLGSRVFGVHLLAGTYLSELATAGEVGALTDVTFPITTCTGMSEPPPVEAPAAAPVVNEVRLGRMLPEEAKALMSGLINGDANEAATCSTPASVPPASLGGAIAMFWPESSFRLTKQGDGRAVIWLRDYRTPDEHASRLLVDELVRVASAANMRLGRIVLNGREVWTSRQNY